jgi:hypothetical protein
MFQINLILKCLEFYLYNYNYYLMKLPLILVQDYKKLKEPKILKIIYKD